MISILCNWILVTVMAFVAGFTVLSPIAKSGQYQIRNLYTYIAAGLVAFTVYAQVWSFFYRVGAVAFITLGVIVIILFAVQAKNILRTLRSVKKPVPEWVGLAILVLLAAFGASRGYMHYDTALYHAQAIRWVEEYGVVKGLGLFHARFGYNSAAFPLQALFSFSWAFKEPMHAMSGYLVLLMACPALKLGRIFTRKSVRVSDFLRIGAFYYLTLVLFDMVAPASDYFAMAAVIFAVEEFADLLDERERNPIPYAFLTLWALFAVTMKLSVGFMGFIFLFPLVMFAKKKQGGKILLFVLLGCLIVLPMLLRGYLISGWPLYPTTIVSFGSPDWQIPAETAAFDAKEIQAWGRGTQYLPGFETTFSQWVPGWFRSQSVMNKGLLAGDVAAFVGMLIVLPISLLTAKDREKRFVRAGYLLLAGVLTASFLLWLSGAPLVRYGYAFVILPCLLGVGLLFVGACEGTKATKRKLLAGEWIMIVLMMIFVIYKIYGVGRDIAQNYRLPYYVTAQPYEEYPVVEYEAGGHIFYCPAGDGDQTGYKSFPAAPGMYNGGFGGEDLKDGFRIKE